MKTKFLVVLLILSGLLVSADKTYACNDPPNADLDASPNPVCVGCSVTLDGSGSSDPDGEITKYEWDWTNDGEYDYEETPGDGIATHIYTIAGTYTAKLRVTDDDDATDTDTCQVTVVEVVSVTSDKDSASICSDFTFTVTTNPAGHEDLVEWSAPEGDPNSQNGGATFTTKWECTGSKTVTASCCASEKSKNVTVSLPDGCSNAGAHDSTVHWVSPDDDYASFSCAIYGEFAWDSATHGDDFKYDECGWVCEISNVQAKTTILVRAPFSLLPDDVSVESASDVPCDDANLAKYDLDDTDLTDDEGAPRCKYWCYIASVAHEEKHRHDWQGFYGDALSDAITYLESSCHSTIDCGDPDTITCQAAEAYWQLTIQQFFNLARTEAVKSFNDPDTPLNEADQRAYEINYEFEQPISAALPEGCTP